MTIEIDVVTLALFTSLGYLMPPCEPLLKESIPAQTMSKPDTVYEYESTYRHTLEVEGCYYRLECGKSMCTLSREYPGEIVPGQPSAVECAKRPLVKGMSDIVSGMTADAKSVE